jgi:hypothetical protein
MDRFERESTGKPEDAREVVKGGDDDVSAAEMRREAAVAAQNQEDAEQPAGEPQFVVDNPLPGGDGPGVVTEVQSLAPEHGTSPSLIVPADDDDQDEDDDPDAASDFKAGPTPASPILPEVQAVSGLPISRERLDVLELKSDDFDPGTSTEPVQNVFDYPDFLDVQVKADVNYDPGQSAMGDDAALTQLDGDPDRPILPGVSTGVEVNTITDTTGSMGGTVNSAREEGTVDSSRLLDDEATTTNVMPGDNIRNMLTDQQVISGDYDNMQDGPAAVNIDGNAGNKVTDIDTTGGELDFESVTESADDPQPSDPQVTNLTGFGSFEPKAQSAGDDTSEAMIEDRPLEFIIGDMMPGSGGILDVRAADDTNVGQIGERPLEFKPTSSMEAETVADGEGADVALGGPDTASRIVGLPDVPDVAEESPESPAGFLDTLESIDDTYWEPNADPPGMSETDVGSIADDEPLSYNQAETLASSLVDDDDDGDSFDGM